MKTIRSLLARISHILSNQLSSLHHLETWSTGALACVPKIESRARAPVLHFFRSCKRVKTYEISGLVTGKALPSSVAVLFFLFLVWWVCGVVTNPTEIVAADGANPKGKASVADASNYPSLKEAVSALGTSRATLTISTPQSVTDNLTIPATVTLHFTGEGEITVANGKQLTIRGPVVATPVRIFQNALAGQGTVNFDGNQVVQEVYPEWWGASPTASAATNTPALQAAIQGAFGVKRTNATGDWKYNRLLKFSGIYEIDDELKCYHMLGFRWEGQNKFNSGLRQTKENKRIIDGQSVAYGVFSNLNFSTCVKQGDGIALLDINYDAKQGNDLRPQNITFQDCVFGGNGVGFIGVWLCRAGGGAQGDNIRFYNCYASGFTFAAAVLGGANTPPLNNSGYAYNAIYVQWIGGDIQGCPKYGLASYGGSWIVKWVTMENQCPDAVGAPAQTGADFYFEAPQNYCILEDIRSESLRFLQGQAIIRNCATIPYAQFWYNRNGGGFLAGTTSYPNEWISGTGYGGDGKTYRVTSAPASAKFGGLALTTATSTSAGPPATITVNGAKWTANEFAGYRATIISAAHGKRQYGIIASNTADTITLTDLGDGVCYKTDFVPQALYPDFQVVNPSGNVQFVVEPNWGKQFSSTVKGLTTKWEEFPFNTVDGFCGIIDGLIAYGKIRFTSPTVIQNLTVSRQDWANDANAVSHTIPRDNWSNIYVMRWDQQEVGIPWTFPANGGPITFPSVSVEQKGSEWIVWNRACYGGGPKYPTLGIGPGDDGFSGLADVVNKDILAFWGKLGRQTPNGTNQAGTPTQIQGGLSTGSGAPGAIEFWLGKTGVSGTQVNGPATRHALLDTSGLALGSGAASPAIGAAPTHGQCFQMLAGEEIVRVSAKGTARTSMELPANAVVFAISVRVIEDIPGAETFTVASGGHIFSTEPVATKVGSTNPGTAGAPFNMGSSPAPITIKTAVTPEGDHGKVRITAHYYVVTPPAN